MPNLHLLNADGLSEAIKSADYLAHVMPASILDPETRTSLDSFHADLQDEAERRVQARRQDQVDQAMTRIPDQDS